MAFVNHCYLAKWLLDLRVDIWPDLLHFRENPLLDLLDVRHIEDVNFEV